MVAVAACRRRLQTLQRVAGTEGRPSANDRTKRLGVGGNLCCMGLGSLCVATCKGSPASGEGGFWPRPLRGAGLCVG